MGQWNMWFSWPGFNKALVAHLGFHLDTSTPCVVCAQPRHQVDSTPLPLGGAGSGGGGHSEGRIRWIQLGARSVGGASSPKPQQPTAPNNDCQDHQPINPINGQPIVSTWRLPLLSMPKPHFPALPTFHAFLFLLPRYPPFGLFSRELFLPWKKIWNWFPRKFNILLINRLYLACFYTP